VFGGLRLVTESDRPSHEVTAPCRVSNRKTLAPLLLQRSPHALYPRELGYRVFTLRAPEKQLICSRDPLMGFGSPSEVAQAPSRRFELPASRQFRRSRPIERRLAAPPLRSRPLQRLPARSSGMNGRDCVPGPPAPSGIHNLLAPSSAPSLPALFHAGSALGVTLQSFVPPSQPHAVPSAVTLVTFETPSGCCSARESATRSSCLS
jgi:hypothetical protein